MKNVAIIIAIAIAAFAIYKFALDTEPEALNAPEIVNSTTDEPTAETEELQLISPAAAGADVFILEPGDGSIVSSPVTVKFGITNMTVTKAGDNQKYSGHHHLLINLDELPPMDQPLPASEQLIHFGGGQTETSIDLEPGEHTLQLLLGNYLHIPHDKPIVSKKITITVE